MHVKYLGFDNYEQNSWVYELTDCDNNYQVNPKVWLFSRHFLWMTLSSWIETKMMMINFCEDDEFMKIMLTDYEDDKKL